MKGLTIGQVVCLSGCTIDFTSDKGGTIRVVCNGGKAFEDDLVFFRINKGETKEVEIFKICDLRKVFWINVSWGSNKTTFYVDKEQLCKTDVASAVSYIEQYIETCEAQLSDLQKQFSI